MSVPDAALWLAGWTLSGFAGIWVHEATHYAAARLRGHEARFWVGLSLTAVLPRVFYGEDYDPVVGLAPLTVGLIVAMGYVLTAGVPNLYHPLAAFWATYTLLGGAADFSAASARLS